MLGLWSVVRVDGCLHVFYSSRRTSRVTRPYKRLRGVFQSLVASCGYVLFVGCYGELFLGFGTGRVYRELLFFYIYWFLND